MKRTQQTTVALNFRFDTEIIKRSLQSLAEKFYRLLLTQIVWNCRKKGAKSIVDYDYLLKSSTPDI